MRLALKDPEAYRAAFAADMYAMMDAQCKRQQEKTNRKKRNGDHEEKAPLSPSQNSTGKNDSEKEKVKQWLENTVKLPQYYHTFMEQGIEDLASVQDLTIQNLSDIGIENEGHQHQIMQHVQLLQQPQAAVGGHHDQQTDRVEVMQLEIDAMKQQTQQQLVKIEEQSMTLSQLQEAEKQHNEAMAAMQARIESLSVKLEQQTKQNDSLQRQIQGIQQQVQQQHASAEKDGVSAMMKEFGKLKEQIARLQKQANRNDDDEQKEEETEQEKVKKWLESTVKLPQYYQVFIDEGVEDMESVQDLSVQNLRDIGIVKVGHQNKIMKYAKLLKQPQQPPVPPAQEMIVPQQGHRGQANWSCIQCETMNFGYVSQCSLCGWNKVPQKQMNVNMNDVEGTIVYDTAK